MSGTNVVIPVEEISAYPVNHLQNAEFPLIVIIGVVIMSIKIGHLILKVIMFVTGNIVGIGTQTVSVSGKLWENLAVTPVLPVLPVGYV